MRRDVVERIGSGGASKIFVMKPAEDRFAVDTLRRYTLHRWKPSFAKQRLLSKTTMRSPMVLADAFLPGRLRAGTRVSADGRQHLER